MYGLTTSNIHYKQNVAQMHTIEKQAKNIVVLRSKKKKLYIHH